MKIAYGSDLHLEFGKIHPLVFPEADILILAGDICCVVDLERDNTHPLKAPLVKFFKEASKHYEYVLWIYGNHEHYGYDIDKSLPFAFEKLVIEQGIKNLILLNNEEFSYKDVTFFCGTMWTDLSNPSDAFMARKNMNDYRVVYDSGKKLTPERTHKEHTLFYDMLLYNLPAKQNKVVVVSHHAPCSLSIPEVYRGDYRNALYYTDMTPLILNNEQIKLWIHGHVHNINDYVVGSTRIVSNPRGYYGVERQDSSFEFKIVEV